MLLATSQSSPYRLVVCDLDGTLVSHTLGVSAAVRRVVALINAQPHLHMVIATGRMHPSALLYANELGLLHEPVISYQGAMGCLPHPDAEPLFHTPIARATGLALGNLCRDEGFHLNAYCNNVLHSQPHPVYVDDYRRTSRIEPTVVDDIRDVLAETPSSKMVIIERDPKRMDTLRQRIASQFANDVTLCLSRPHFLELTQQGVSKWTAVAQVAQHYGIEPAAVVCVGDQENDLSMIEAAGLGIAMGNEHDGAAKALAERVLGLSLAEVMALPAEALPLPC
jgi:Cof subfamily protein (haloacid dehalogenase superfamily)